MENKIDKIITLADGRKYMILNQAYYQDTSYLFVACLDEKEQLTNVISIMEEVDGEIVPVTEPVLLKAMAEYFKNNM